MDGIEVEEEAKKGKWTKEGAEKCKGFSGRELAKVMIAVQGVLYGSEKGKLREEDIKRVIRQKVVEHEEKKMMLLRGANGK